MKKCLAGILTVVAALGIIALATPTPVALARPCVLCPQVFIECPTCYDTIPQTCEHCAYCQKIKGCHP
jgi:hypothetical protein